MPRTDDAANDRPSQMKVFQRKPRSASNSLFSDESSTAAGGGDDENEGSSIAFTASEEHQEVDCEFGDKESLPPQNFRLEQRVFARDHLQDSLLYEALVKKVGLRPGPARSKKPNVDGGGGSADKSPHTSTLSSVSPAAPAGTSSMDAVVDASGEERHWEYLVHYLGWSSRWDKWLADPDLLEDTPANRAMAQVDKEKAKKKERERKEKAKEKERAKAERKKARKLQEENRKRDADDMEDDDEYEDAGPTIEDYCALPFTLKTVLVDDRDKIRTAAGWADELCPPEDDAAWGSDEEEGREGWRPPRLVHSLPAPITIRKVLKGYVKLKKQEAAAEAAKVLDAAEEKDSGEDEGETSAAAKAAASAAVSAAEAEARGFVEGVAALFNDALPVCLLYEEERAQYASTMAEARESRDVEANGTTPPLGAADLYGCEHFLRLFVRLPALFSVMSSRSGGSDRTSAAVEELGPWVADLIVFLQKNRNACFKGRYRAPMDKELSERERSLVLREAASLKQQQQQEHST